MRFVNQQTYHWGPHIVRLFIVKHSMVDQQLIKTGREFALWMDSMWSPKNTAMSVPHLCLLVFELHEYNTFRYHKPEWKGSYVNPNWTRFRQWGPTLWECPIQVPAAGAWNKAKINVPIRSVSDHVCIGMPCTKKNVVSCRTGFNMMSKHQIWGTLVSDKPM